MGPDSSQESAPLDISCFADERDNKEDSQVEPKQLQDKPKDQGKKLIEVNLAALEEEVRPVFISANVSQEMKESLLRLLREFKDVFA